MSNDEYGPKLQTSGDNERDVGRAKELVIHQDWESAEKNCEMPLLNHGHGLTCSKSS